MNIEEFYQSFQKKFNQDYVCFVDTIQKSSRTEQAKFFEEILLCSIQKRDKAFFNAFINSFSMKWYISHQSFPFYEILKNAPELLCDPEQMKLYGVNIWEKQAEQTSHIVYPEKNYKYESAVKCQKIELLLIHGKKFHQEILNSILNSIIFSPEIKMIQFLEKYIDYTNLENQKKMFLGYQELALSNFKFSNNKDDTEYHREQLGLEVLDYLIPKMDILKYQNKDSKKLMKELHSDKKCVSKWLVIMEMNKLKANPNLTQKQFVVNKI